MERRLRFVYVPVYHIREVAPPLAGASRSRLLPSLSMDEEDGVGPDWREDNAGEQCQRN